ncbi:unnamed protein product [Thelazia callipaeda]|uniref:LAM_G_DOMAIN domain-containing protein n=1 Tax=Thelazia callipaeda TaxID=103827 RepID=A0A0N5CSX0_THECL|nr:unnamed protein product [Thelazia callipaeda]
MTPGAEHYMVVDNTSTIMDALPSHPVKFKANFYIGSTPPDVLLSPGLKDAPGFRGCISSLRLGTDYVDLPRDASKSYGVVKGCHGPRIRCTPKYCSNRGKCIQHWESIRCDCSMTTFGGEKCESPATTYIFDSASSAIYYEYPRSIRPSTNQDYLAVGFRTRQASAVLFSVHCKVDGDFFTVFLKDGYLHIRYNLGSRDHHVSFLDATLNDDVHHAVITYRQEANLTLYIDDRKPIYYFPSGTEMDLVTLNMQWRLTIGASFNLLHRTKRRKRERIFDSYNGFISGVNFNGLMILDMLAEGCFLVI